MGYRPEQILTNSGPETEPIGTEIFKTVKVEITSFIMTDVEALITLARRYCQDNFSYWADKYSKERTGNYFPYTYTDKDYNLFPRYNVLSVILSSIETLVGKNFENTESCKNELKT